MSSLTRTVALLAALALVAAACGGASEPASELPTDPAAGACLAGDPDCNDIPGNDTPALEPGDQLPTDGGVIGAPIIGGGLTVADVLTTDVDGPLAVVGFLVQDGDGARLCDGLAESLPPQCAGASIELSDTSTIDPDELRTEQGVTWTDTPVSLIGEVVSGVFTVTPLSN
jgi:hypothetical protein